MCLENLLFAAKQPLTCPSQELYTMLRQSVRDSLSLLPPTPSGVWQGRFVPTFTARPEEAGAMGRSCQFYRILALQSQGVEHHQQTYWHVRTLASSVPYFSKLLRFTTRKERGTQDEGPRVHKNKERPTYGSSQHLRKIASLAP